MLQWRIETTNKCSSRIHAGTLNTSQHLFPNVIFCLLLLYDSDFLNPLGCHFWQIFFLMIYLWFEYDFHLWFFYGFKLWLWFFMVWIWFFYGFGYDFFMIFLCFFSPQNLVFSYKNSRNFRFFYDFARVSFSPKPFQQKIWFWKQNRKKNRKKIVKKS